MMIVNDDNDDDDDNDDNDDDDDDDDSQWWWLVCEKYTLKPLAERLSMWPASEMLDVEKSDDRRIPPFFQEGKWWW